MISCNSCKLCKTGRCPCYQSRQTCTYFCGCSDCYENTDGPMPENVMDTGRSKIFQNALDGRWSIWRCQHWNWSCHWGWGSHGLILSKRSYNLIDNECLIYELCRIVASSFNFVQIWQTKGNIGPLTLVVVYLFHVYGTDVGPGPIFQYVHFSFIFEKPPFQKSFAQIWQKKPR